MKYAQRPHIHTRNVGAEGVKGWGRTMHKHASVRVSGHVSVRACGSVSGVDWDWHLIEMPR